MNPIDTHAVANEPVVESPPSPMAPQVTVTPQPAVAQPEQPAVPQPVKITVLEGMKVLFDEKVGLAPVQVVEKRERMNGRNGKNGNGYAYR